MGARLLLFCALFALIMLFMGGETARKVDAKKQADEPGIVEQQVVEPLVDPQQEDNGEGVEVESEEDGEADSEEHTEQDDRATGLEEQGQESAGLGK